MWRVLYHVIADCLFATDTVRINEYSTVERSVQEQQGDVFLHIYNHLIQANMGLLRLILIECVLHGMGSIRALTFMNREVIL